MIMGSHRKEDESSLTGQRLRPAQGERTNSMHVNRIDQGAQTVVGDRREFFGAVTGSRRVKSRHGVWGQVWCVQLHDKGAQISSVSLKVDSIFDIFDEGIHLKFR